MPRLFAALGRIQQRGSHCGRAQGLGAQHEGRPWDHARLDVPTYLRRGLVIEGLPGWRKTSVL